MSHESKDGNVAPTMLTKAGAVTGVAAAAVGGALYLGHEFSSISYGSSEAERTTHTAPLAPTEKTTGQDGAMKYLFGPFSEAQVCAQGIQRLEQKSIPKEFWRQNSYKPGSLVGTTIVSFSPSGNAQEWVCE